MSNQQLPCPECSGWFPRTELKWHRELVHNKDSEKTWLERQASHVTQSR